MKVCVTSIFPYIPKLACTTFVFINILKLIIERFVPSFIKVPKVQQNHLTSSSWVQPPCAQYSFIVHANNFMSRSALDVVNS